MQIITKLKQFLLTNTSSKQTVIKNTFWLLLAEGISKGSLAVLVIMIGRIFGKEVFGQYSYLSVLLTFLIVFADLGITQLTIRDYQHLDVKHRRQYLISGLWTKLRLSIAVAIAYFIILYFTASSSFLRFIGLILLSNNLTNSFLEYMRSTFRSLQRGETELRVKFVQGIGNLLLIPLLFVYQSLPLNLIGQSVVTLVTIGYTWYLVRSRQLTEHTDEIITTKKQLIQNGWMFAMSGLAVSLYYYIDSVIIQYYWGYEAVGVYSAAYRIALLFAIPIGMLGQSVFPAIQKLSKIDLLKAFSTIRDIAIVAFLGSCVVFIIAIYYSGRILSLTYGEKYLLGNTIFKLLLFAMWITYIYSILGRGLIGLGKQKIHTYISVVGLLINVILNLVLVPRHGIMGGAISTVITELTICILFIVSYFSLKLKLKI